MRKNCANVRKNARACGNTAPVVRKFDPVRVRNLRDRAKSCVNARKPARAPEIRPRSCGDLAPVALEFRAIARENCANVRETSRSRGNPDPVVRKSGSCRVRNLYDCANKQCGCAKNSAADRKSGSSRAEIRFRSRYKFGRLCEKCANVLKQCERAEIRPRSCGDLFLVALEICANERKTGRSRRDSAPVVRKSGPGRLRNFRDCAKKTARMCEKLCAIAKIWIRSCGD